MSAACAAQLTTDRLVCCLSHTQFSDLRKPEISAKKAVRSITFNSHNMGMIAGKDESDTASNAPGSACDDAHLCHTVSRHTRFDTRDPSRVLRWPLSLLSLEPVRPTSMPSADTFGARAT